MHLIEKTEVSQEVIALRKTEADSINYIALQVEVDLFLQLNAEPYEPVVQSQKELGCEWFSHVIVVEVH